MDHSDEKMSITVKQFLSSSVYLMIGLSRDVHKGDVKRKYQIFHNFLIRKNRRIEKIAG